MAKKIIALEDIGTVTLTKRRGNTHIRLRYGRDGSVQVSLPYFVPYQTGIEFVRSKRDWLEKHRPLSPKPLEAGQRIGKAHRLQFVIKAGSQSCRVHVKQNLVVVAYPDSLTPDSEEVQKAARRGILKALKLEADKLLPQRLSQLASQYGFKYRSVATKRLSSRWGSCSQHQEITLNTYLMQVSWELIDYVILHELVHTEHLNHSAAFWQRFESVLPDARARRKQLKRHQTEITPTAI